MSDSSTVPHSHLSQAFCQVVKPWGVKEYFPLVMKDFSRRLYQATVEGNIRHMMENVYKDRPSKEHMPQQVTPSPSLKHVKKSVKFGPSIQARDNTFIHMPWKDSEEGVIG